VTNTEGCTDAVVSKVEVYSSTSTSIGDRSAYENNFTLAPNPTTDVLNVFSDSPVEVSRVEIYSGAGIMHRSFDVNKKVTHHGLSLEQLTPGLYYVLIHTELGVDTHKVVKM